MDENHERATILCKNVIFGILFNIRTNPVKPCWFIVGLLFGCCSVGLRYLHNIKPPSVQRFVFAGRENSLLSAKHDNTHFHPLTAKLFNLNFQPLEVVSR